MNEIDREIQDITRRALTPKVVDRLLRDHAAVKLLWPQVPRTRWERFKMRIERYQRRIALAWRALRGDDFE